MTVNKNQDTTKVYLPKAAPKATRVVNSNMFDIWHFPKLCASVPLHLCNYSTKVVVSGRTGGHSAVYVITYATRPMILLFTPSLTVIYSQLISEYSFFHVKGAEVVSSV